MKDKIIEIAKVSGFYVNGTGIWAKDPSGEVTEQVTDMTREVIEQCIRAVSILGSFRTTERDNTIREVVAALEEYWQLQTSANVDTPFQSTVVDVSVEDLKALLEGKDKK
jgi:hypothetical protein